MSLPSSPNTRKEMYLSNMAGQGTALPSEPHTREEEYLDYIAKNGGGGGGTGDGDMKKSVYDGDLAVAGAGGIKSYVTGAISGKVDKVTGKGLSTNDYDDSAKAIVDGVTAELGNKADKVSSATNGDLASLDSNGNLTDSGKKASDFYNSSETLETDLDGADKFPFYDFSASAKRHITFGSIKVKLKEYFDLFYTNLVSSATAGNFAGLDANGNLTDSGKKASDFATASSVTAILDGTSIDSFSDVESALADKVDVVSGKGLSTNDYDNTAKGIVDNIQSNVIANTKLIKDTVGFIGKNKLIITNTGETKSGATLTVSLDKKCNFSGTTTIGVTFNLSPHVQLPLIQGEPYKLTGISALQSVNGFVDMFGTNADEPASADWEAVFERKQSDYEFTLSTVYKYYRFNATIPAGKSLGITISPMIYDADILDDTYEPYFGSTAFPRSEQAVLGAKNLLENKAVSQIANGATFTVNDDKTVTVSTNATSDATLDINSSITIPKKMILTGCPSGGGQHYALVAKIGSTYLTESGNGLELEAGTYRIYILVKTGYGSGLVFKPMISFDGGEYVPHAMTNEQLTDAVAVKDGTVTSDFTVAAETMLSKVGKLVTCAIRINDITSATAWTTAICNIPQGYRPKGTSSRMMIGYSNSAICLVNVSGYDGSVVPSVGITNGSVIFTGSWVTD